MSSIEQQILALEESALIAAGITPGESPAAQISALVAAIWDEALHPRGRDGKFINKGGFVKGVFNWMKDIGDSTNPAGKGLSKKADRVKIEGFSSGNGATSSNPWVKVSYDGPDPELQGLSGFARAVDIDDVTPVKARLDGQTEMSAEGGPEAPGSSKRLSDALGVPDTELFTRWDPQDGDGGEQSTLQRDFEYTAPDGRVFGVRADIGIRENEDGTARIYDANVQVDNATGAAEYQSLDLDVSDREFPSIEEAEAFATDWVVQKLDTIDETGEIWNDSQTPYSPVGDGPQPQIRIERPEDGSENPTSRRDLSNVLEKLDAIDEMGEFWDDGLSDAAATPSPEDDIDLSVMDEPGFDPNTLTPGQREVLQQKIEERLREIEQDIADLDARGPQAVGSDPDPVDDDDDFDFGPMPGDPDFDDGEPTLSPEEQAYEDEVRAEEEAADLDDADSELDALRSMSPSSLSDEELLRLYRAGYGVGSAEILREFRRRGLTTGGERLSPETE